MEDDSEGICFEVLESNEVPESELSEFQETQIIVGNKEDTTLKHEVIEQGALIKKFVSGESELPDLFTKLSPKEEESDDDDNTQMKLEEQPCTSSQARSSSYTNVSKSSLNETEERIRSYRKRTMLPSNLQGLMGEANLCYARGQSDIAEKICLEIIRLSPLSSEPFETLAQIYEFKDTEKFLNFLTIAVHLNPHVRENWIRIAEMHIEEENLSRARIFYTKAIKALPKDYDLRLRKAQLLEKMNESNAAMFAYLRMIPHVPPERAELCLVTAKNVAHHFHGLGKTQIALEAMEGAYGVCARLFTLEDLNLYLELLILNKYYRRVLHCLKNHTNLELETDEVDGVEIILFCNIPDNYLDDFRAKACVCLINLDAQHLFGYIQRNVHKHIPVVNERLDLYIDIAEAYMQKNKYPEAVTLLKPITDGDLVDCPAFVWLRNAECLRHLNQTNEAIESYQHVVELAPFCYEAKFTLSALLKQQGRHIEAVKALEQSEEMEGQPLNVRLLYERAIMLKQIGEIDEFLDVGYMLISRNSLKLRSREEMFAAANGGNFYNAEGLKIILQMRNLTEDSDKMLQEHHKAQSENSDLTLKDEYELFMELIRTAYAHKKFSYLERICFSLVTTKRFTSFHTELERIIILACYFNDDCVIGFMYLRELISKNPSKISLWNMLSLMVQKGQDQRYHRYVGRLLHRQPMARPMRLFLAHYHLYCSSYKYALNIYAPIFKEKNDPLIGLCIAVVFNQISLQKKVLRKSAAVAQALVFAEKYAALRRGKDTPESCAAEQEICYNIGRIYHQAGLMHLAIEYYERGLAVQHPLIKENEEYLSLTYETAYNLHLIYKSNGNLHKARQCLYKYCVI